MSEQQKPSQKDLAYDSARIIRDNTIPFHEKEKLIGRNVDKIGIGGADEYWRYLDIALKELATTQVPVSHELSEGQVVEVRKEE